MATVLTHKDFAAERATWCPGCGDFAVLRAFQEACVRLALAPHRVVVVSGIGCSGKIASYMGTYGFHTHHGRTLPVATGIKLANRGLTVIAAAGDGDAYGIGLNHLIHAIRRDVDVTYVIMDNGVYGNTKGQTSPTTSPGTPTPSSPLGAVDEPVHPLRLALAAGATYLAQGSSGDPAQLTRLVEQGIAHRGFALINVISPCPTYDRVRTYAWWRERLRNIDDDAGYDAADPARAWEVVASRDTEVVGLLYRAPRRALDERLPGFAASPLAGETLSPDLDRVRRILDDEYTL
jgi:2-oxoglutarate/2-oxoacid ferredoxin oxidoreductase subunit beta